MQYLLFALLFFGGPSFGVPYFAGPSFGVKVVGHGPPMILIPGMKGDGMGTFSSTVDHFKDRYTCYVITLAGFAGQPPTGAVHDLLRGQRDELLAYIHEQHLSKPVLVGFSFGGTLALWMASADPGLFGPVIDLDGAPFDAGFDDPSINVDSLDRRIDARLARFAAASPAEIAHMDSVWNSPASRAMGYEYLKKLVSDTARIPLIMKWDALSDFRASAIMNTEGDRLDLRDSIRRIKSSVLVLGSWKGYDHIGSKKEAMDIMLRQFDHASVTIAYSSTGKHFLMWDDFDWMVGMMDTFLRDYDLLHHPPPVAHAQGSLTFHSHGLAISVRDGKILVNQKVLYTFPGDYILYDGEFNRVVQSGGATFLFLSWNENSEDDDHIDVFKVTLGHVGLLATTVSDTLMYFPKDSSYVFGGHGIYEVPPSRDSMYYHPCLYYKLRDGKVFFDSAYSRKMDIKENGVYLRSDQWLDRNGYCCVTVVKPGMENLIFSERIDGPANVRASKNGEVLFSINDNVPVTTGDTSGHWYPVTLTVDWTDAATIARGSKLYFHGKEVGKAVSDIPVTQMLDRISVLKGYTSFNNIKIWTQPEKVLSRLLTTYHTLPADTLARFIQDFGLYNETFEEFQGYELEQDDRHLRMGLYYWNNALFAVVTDREMDIPSRALDHGYHLTILGHPDPDMLNRFIGKISYWASNAN